MSQIEFNNRLQHIERSIKYFALSLTANPEDAKDLVQETMLKALVNRDKFVNPDNLKAWVYTIMKNIFINQYRRKVRSKTTFDDTNDQYFLNRFDEPSDRDPDTEYSINEIQKSINNLEDEYKVPFTMHNDGYKYKEIADELAIPIGTVKSRIFFSRKKLMESLKDYQS